MLISRGKAGFSGVEASGDEGGGSGNGKGAGLTPTGPDAAEGLSGMKELPSAGGLGSGGDAAGGAGAGVTVGPEMMTGPRADIEGGGAVGAGRDAGAVALGDTIVGVVAGAGGCGGGA